ncbi:MAG: hypothetical protein ACREXJ_10600 [Gammaproteobacteria bacterium]
MREREQQMRYRRRKKHRGSHLQGKTNVSAKADACKPENWADCHSEPSSQNRI